MCPDLGIYIFSITNVKFTFHVLVFNSLKSMKNRTIKSKATEYSKMGGIGYLQDNKHP